MPAHVFFFTTVHTPVMSSLSFTLSELGPCAYHVLIYFSHVRVVHIEFVAGSAEDRPTIHFVIARGEI